MILLPATIGIERLTPGLRSSSAYFRSLFLTFKDAYKIMVSDPGRASPSIASTSSNGTTQKRKRPGDGVKYYAVRRGRVPGVYQTWDECKSHITGHKGALCT